MPFLGQSKTEPFPLQNFYFQIVLLAFEINVSKHLQKWKPLITSGVHLFDRMSIEIHTEGSCTGANGSWSFRVEYRYSGSDVETIYSDSGETPGTTDVQMKLMAILKSLTYVRSIFSEESIIIKSDCPLCIKCITKEFDCTSDDAFKRAKVTRGFVQYLQEIWWKMSGLNVRFEESTDSTHNRE